MVDADAWIWTNGLSDIHTDKRIDKKTSHSDPVSHSLDVYILLMTSQSFIDDVTNASMMALWLFKILPTAFRKVISTADFHNDLSIPWLMFPMVFPNPYEDSSTLSRSEFSADGDG